MDSLAEIIGKNIRKRRQALGLSQLKLGLAVYGYENNVLISAWENGRSCPGAYYLWRLGQAFGCTIDELFEGVE